MQSEAHLPLKVWMEFCPYFLHFSSCLGKIHYRNCPQKLVSCMEICIMRAILFLRMQMSLQPYFPHWSNLFEFPNKRPRYNTGKHLWVSLKLAQGRPYFFTGTDEITFMCVPWNHIIYTVKITLVNSVYYWMEYTICTSDIYHQSTHKMKEVCCMIFKILMWPVHLPPSHPFQTTGIL